MVSVLPSAKEEAFSQNLDSVIKYMSFWLSFSCLLSNKGSETVWNFTTSLEATVLCSGSHNFWGSSLLVCSVVLMGGDMKSTALGSYPNTVTVALGKSLTYIDLSFFI